MAKYHPIIVFNILFYRVIKTILFLKNISKIIIRINLWAETKKVCKTPCVQHHILYIYDMYDDIELVYTLDVKANAFPPHLTIVYLRRRFTFMRRGKTVNPSVWGSHAVAMDTVVSQMAAIHSASPIIPIRASFPFAHLIDFFFSPFGIELGYKAENRCLGSL